MSEQDWVILNYTIPKEPSRIRVGIWRKLKKRGSVSIGQSMWVLPLSKENIDFFHDISNDIVHNKGGANMMEAAFIRMENQGSIVKLFDKARDEEYCELLEKCEDFFHEIDKEIQKENYTFAEVEENEYEYNKLTEWYSSIKERDFFCAPLSSVSELKLEECRMVLEDFSEKVYAINNDMN